MTIQSGFFNSINGDRKYSASNFAEYFASFIGNGVFPTPSNGMQVVEDENMNIVVKAGKGWINGYFVVNDSDYILTLDNADGVLKRIDRVVMRLNYTSRQIEIDVKKGTFASNPVAPNLQRDTDAYELALADVLINNGVTQITPSAITDTRLSDELCGIVHGLVDQVSTETLYQQYLDFWNDWRTQQVDEFEQFQTDTQVEFDTQMQTNQTTFENQTVMNQQEFDDWFATVQGILSGDVAGNLLTLINNLSDDSIQHSRQKASKTEFGHVKIGTGLKINDGVVSGGELAIEIYDVPGTYNWIAPKGVDKVYITAAAGGGGGSFGFGSTSNDKYEGASGGVTTFGSILTLSGGGGASQYGGGGASGGVNATGGITLPGGSNLGAPTLLPFVVNGGGNLFGVGASKNSKATGYGCGGSGHYTDQTNGFGSGGGGAGDCVIKRAINVEPEQSYTIIVGAGGKGGVRNASNVANSNGRDGVLIIEYQK